MKSKAQFYTFWQPHNQEAYYNQYSCDLIPWKYADIIYKIDKPKSKDYVSRLGVSLGSPEQPFPEPNTQHQSQQQQRDPNINIPSIP